VFHVAHLIGQAQKKAFSCNRVGLIIAGYEINHCHLHVIPTNSMHQLSFANAALSVTPDDLRDSANTLRSMLASVGLKASE
jgi:diadenosine tetraphosphate (Ap4A) HIT family hydrolase